MKRSQIMVLQTKLGMDPDGFWGPKSIAACQAHLRKLMPKPNPWPKADQKSLQTFYGSPGDESCHTMLDVTKLGVCYDGKPVKYILCHTKVAASLERILGTLPEAVLTEYAGVYNNRPMRGGTSPSLHARAAAIDLDPDDNGNRQAWPSSATMPLEVMEAFAREGWLAAGAFWGRDAMHFQATQ